MQYSVVIPVFNRQEPIKKAIQSVLDQDYQDWECIIVDDASTDDTYSVCQKYEKSDARIKAVHLDKNGGVSVARNAGIDLCRGEYILFLDSDDQLRADAMSTLSAVIRKNDVDIVVFASSQQWTPPANACNQVLDQSFIRKNIFPQHINIEPQTGLFLQPYVCNKCIKMPLIRDNGIRFDAWRRTWEDNVFLVKCLNKCNSMVIIPDKLYLIGDYPETGHLSNHIDSELFLNYIKSFKRNRDMYGDEFNFRNDYTPRRYFDVIHEHLILYFERCKKEEFIELLSKLMQDQAMKEWVDRIKSKNAIEDKIKKAFADNNLNELFKVYMQIHRENSGKRNQILRRARSAIVRLVRSR